MSALYVRDLCQQWAQALPTPYYNTINMEQDPQDETWVTLEFQTIGKSRDTYCSEVENGIVSLVYFGKPGVGFEDLLALAEPQVEAFVDNVDPTGRLTLELSQPPSDFTGLGAPSYIVEFAVNYTFR